jgi:hypothetical protein
MAYTTNVTLLDSEGGPTTADITARVWMLWSVLGTGTGTGNMQSEEGSAMGLVMKDQSAPLQVNFPGNTNFAYANRSVGFSVQDTPRVANDTGWLFRSGDFPDDLPAESVEIVTATRSFTSTEVAAMIGTPPFTIDPGTTTIVTALTVTFALNAVDFMATGTTMATGTLLTFTGGGRLTMAPSSDIRAAATEAINAGVSNVAITFTGAGVAGSIQASVANSLSGFALNVMRPQIRQAVESRLNADIAQSIGRSLQTGNTLPPGVMLSIRSVNITADPGGTLAVRGALGAFGGVFSKLPPIQVPTGGGRTCFIATAVHGANSPEVQLLREFRDGLLVNHSAGRKFVSIYERLSPPLADFISNRQIPKAMARGLVVKPGVWLAKLFRNE